MTYETFLAELEALLDDLDEVEMTEDIEELNANFEDVLFMLSESGDDEEELADALEDACDELSDIAAGYKNIIATAELGKRLTDIVARYNAGN